MIAMRESKMRAPVLLIVASLAAMAPAALSARSNRGVESVHQPVVQRSDYTFDVPAGELGSDDRARVLQWFDALGLDYGDRVSVDTGTAPGTPADAIAPLVARYGLFLSDGAPVTPGALAPGNMRIVVSRSVAAVPACPDYSAYSQPNFTGAASSNFGCGINSTIAAMVANPEDLVRGRRGRGSTADTAAKAIKVWRDAVPTSQNGLKIESTKGGGQ